MNVTKLDVAMKAAEDQGIANWCIDEGGTVPLTSDEWASARSRFYKLTWEQRDKYRVRPTMAMAAEAGDWLETDDGKAYTNVWDVCGTYAVAVRDTLSRYEKDWDIVDDLMYDTFIRAAENVDQYEGRNEAKMSTWLLTLATNVGKNHVESTQADKRKNEVLAVHMSSDDDDGYDVPYYEQAGGSTYVAEASAVLDPALVVEAEDTYADALSRMPPRMAAVVQLRREGASNSLIAQDLGIADQTVRAYLTRSSDYLINNRDFILSNRLSERDEGNALRRPRSCADVERAQRERFFRRDSALRKRAVRMASPEASTAEWKEQY